MRSALNAPILLLTASLLSAAVVSQAPLGKGPNPERGLPAGETPAPTSVWATEWGGFNHIEGIQAVSADSIWAAGSNAVRFDGTRWRAVDRRDYPAGLYGVDVTPLGNGWIVGGDEVLPIRGSALGASMRIPGYGFSDVAMISEDEALAVARRSTSALHEVLRYRDGAWFKEWAAPPGVGLRSIWMASADEGWTAGGSAFHYDGQTWTEWPLPIEGGVQEIVGTEPNDVWAVGGRMHLPQYPEVAPPWRVILHFDGRGWRVVSNEEKSAIWAIALRGDEGVAVTIDGQVLRRRGDGWTETDTWIPAEPFPVGMITAATYVPGTSEVLVARYDGRIYRLEGDQVTVEHDAATLHSVAMLSATKGWALGRDVLEYDGEAWSVIEGALEGAADVATVGGVEAWAVGPGRRVLAYREDLWSEVEFPFAANLVRVAVPAPGAVWILGELPASEGEAAQSAVYTPSPDGTWAMAWRGPGAPRDLAVSGATAAVATSDGIWLSDGGHWSQLRDEGAWSVGIGPAGEIWAGIDGTILAFDGYTWQEEAWLPGSWPVRAFANGANASWAVADWGYVYAFEGGVWRIVRGEAESRGVAGSAYGLRDITTVRLDDGTSVVWAVGAPDTILRAVESDAVAQPAITPEPSPPPHAFPTVSWASWPSITYLPAVHAVADNRSTACIGFPGLPAATTREAALRTARFYASGGPQPEPRLGRLRMLTASEADEEYGTNLAGSTVRGRVVGAGECIWWASFEGWFDCQCDMGTPAPAPPVRNHVWTRLDLALSSDDATVLYEEFSGRRSRPPEPTLAPTGEGPAPTPTGMPIDVRPSQ